MKFGANLKLLGELLQIVSKMRKVIFLFSFLILTSLVHAEITFFDDSNDVFIIGEAGDSSLSSTTISSSQEGGSCRHKWECMNWSACLPPGEQTRKCTNIGTCSDKYNPPEIEQNCTSTPIKIEDNIKRQNETKNQMFEESKEKLKTDENKLYTYFYIIFLVGILLWFIRKDIILKYSKKDKSKSAQKLKKKKRF